MNETHEVGLLQRVWEAMAQGDLTLLEHMLAPDAEWHGVEDGQLCGNRNEILDVIARNLPGRLQGRIEETIQNGPRVIVAFRPERSAQVGRPLDGGIAYVVVTIREGKIIEMKGCADRAAAIAYSQNGERPASPTLDGPRAPDPATLPSEHRVNRLVPFVRVDDVGRSIAFYEHLGFTVESVYRYRERPVWAALESEGAELMVTLDGDPIDPAGQGVLFYLYARDLAALRVQLLAAGIEVGEIEDGSPGPSEEMRLADPDGYVLMVAQTE
ncbi:MAG TPA: nuclear transport factor 2 family protein [Solirubrobacteraceae bacterium]